jgi:hypothetical protein
MAEQNTTLTPGAQTSEGIRSKAITILAVVVAVSGAIMEALTAVQAIVPTNKWLGMSLVIIGTLSASATQIGYALSRGMVKAGHAITLPPPNTADKAAANLDQ